MTIANSTARSGAMSASRRGRPGPTQLRQTSKPLPKHQKHPTKALTVRNQNGYECSVPTARCDERKYRPLAPCGVVSRDLPKATRPPGGLAATHPAAYKSAQTTKIKVEHDDTVAFADYKTAHIRMGLPTPPSPFKPLPSGPLFPPLFSNKELTPPTAVHKPLFSAPRAARPPPREPAPHWSIPADPMQQTSVTAPDWHGKIGVLRSDLNVDLGNVISPERMAGLPLGGMIEIAEYYGPSHSSRSRE